MAVSVVRLGSPRGKGEGPRFGTVRRPPRGVPKADFAKLDYYDLWLPALAPSQALLTECGGPEAVRNVWQLFARRYRAEMKAPSVDQLLNVLSVLSQSTDFAVGCYCADEAFCHRSLLRALFEEKGAKMFRTD